MSDMAVGATIAGQGYDPCLSKELHSKHFTAPQRCSLSGQRSADYCLVWLHVSNGRDADARGADDVDGMDADAWTDMVERRCVVPGHVGRDDGGDDAAVIGTHAMELSRDGWQQRRKARELADCTARHRVLLRLDCVRSCCFPNGATLVEIEMQQPTLARGVPIVIGVVVVMAGALQFSAWKAHHLACCRKPSGRERTLPADAATAWRHGLRLGLHCTYGCAGFTAILLVIGVMDLRMMALVTAAITAERLAPNGQRVARAIGIVVVGVGLLLIARAAAGLG
jgi:hypothetical protein